METERCCCTCIPFPFKRAMEKKRCCCSWIPFRRSGAGSSPSANNNSTIDSGPRASQCQETPLSSISVPTKSEENTIIESGPGASQYQETLLSSTIVPSKSEGDSTVESDPGASQCQVTLLSSTNVPSKSEGENVDVNPNTAGVPKCDEGSSSSSSVPIKSEGEKLDANLNVPGASQCDEGSSSSSSVPIKSDGEKLDANLNNPGASQCDKAATKSDIIKTIKEKDIAANEKDINLDELTEHISQLLKLIEEKKPYEKPSAQRYCTYSPDWKKVYEFLSSGAERLYALKDAISGHVKGILKGVGHASLATTALLVVVYSLERYEELSSNKEECRRLLKEMCFVANVLKQLKESPEGLETVTEDAAALLVEGAIMCCAQINSSSWKKFLKASKDKEDLSGITQKLQFMYSKIDVQIGLRILTEIERERKSPLSKRYPTHAVGIEESVKEVLALLECESEEKAVTVILHGFGGMGKTTLADAVFSKIGGCKYSQVQLFTDIDSKPNVIDLQKKLLKDLMEPKATVTEIRKFQDGQRELQEVLKEVHAFIYIDNVLERETLKMVLPEDMRTAKKVRLLLTAREENVKLACPRSSIYKIYSMKGIHSAGALRILEEEIKEGINDSEFNEIVRICGDIPLMLKLAAAFIGRADNKRKAYDRLMQDKDKWENESFKEMHCLFAYDAIPKNFKDPFLDICSYFKGWDWDTVANIVGEEALESLASRALVTKDAKGLASVHDVILTLARQKSREESQGKEVRLTFTTKAELDEFKGTKGIKGIWVSEYMENVDLSSSTIQNIVHRSMKRFQRGLVENADISSSTLDIMNSSLRVLHLGNVENVSGKCTEKFEKLVFFKAEITELPFDVSKSEQLRYFCYESGKLQLLPKMPSSLRHVEIINKSDDFEISSMALQQLRKLRILRLTGFNSKKLPEELGDLVNDLQELYELSLFECMSIEKLPESISRLKSLRILKIHCSLREWPANIGLLSSLQELSLKNCYNFTTLPNSVENLSSLTLLDLEGCDNLLNLPAGLGNLTGLAELNLNRCNNLKSIPESIRQLKPSRTTDLSLIGLTLKELPLGFCNLSFITSLDLGCSTHLRKLPDGFGQLASLRELHLHNCIRLKKLPEGFGQLKNLEKLVLNDCHHLEELCNDFHCLPSLQNLYLIDCHRLHKLSEDFHRLASLQHLDLSSCKSLKGKWMDHVVKMKMLRRVEIGQSKHLVKRWAEIQRDGEPSWFSITYSQQTSLISKGQWETTEEEILSELDHGQGEPFRISDLRPNTIFICQTDLERDPSRLRDHFLRYLLEETIDEMEKKIEIIYLGSNVRDLFSEKVKDRIFWRHMCPLRVREVFETVCSKLDTPRAREVLENACSRSDLMGSFGYLQMVEDGNSDKCWKCLTESELEEVVLGNCRRYLRLKKLVETTQNSNLELLTALFAPEPHQTTHVFEKNYSLQQGQTESSEHFTCGVDELKGKTILLEMRPHRWFDDIHFKTLKEMYVVMKDKLDLEIISIPTVKQNSIEKLDAYTCNEFSKKIPWLVVQNSWTVITSAVKFFLAKQWEKTDECETWYPSICWIIDPSGKITTYSSSIISMSMWNKLEVVKVLYNHLESVSYRLRWGAKACPLLYENIQKIEESRKEEWKQLQKIEELRKEEWKQLKSMSNLEFLFHHLENGSSEVKKILFQQKIICLYSGMIMSSRFDDMAERNDVRVIYILEYGGENMHYFPVSDTIHKWFYYPRERFYDPRERFDYLRTDLTLVGHEALRFWMRIRQLKEEIKGMDESDKQLSELKSFLHNFQFPDDEYKRDSVYKYKIDSVKSFITFVNKDGKMIATCEGEILKQLQEKKKLDGLIERLVKDLNERHEEDSSISESLTQNMQTAVAAVEQQNVDADLNLDSLREYIYDLLEVEQLHQFFKFSKEGKKWSRPKAIWPTSKGFCMLKDFLAKGINVDWVKEIICGNEEEKWKTVTKRLLKDIGETQWAAAGLVMVAHVLERFDTVSAHRNLCLFLLDAMYTMAIYLECNELRTWMKREATGSIVIGSIMCCVQIDPSKFAMFVDEPVDDKMLRAFLTELNQKLDGMVRSVYFRGFDSLEIFVEADFITRYLEDEGGSSCEDESGISSTTVTISEDEGESEDEGGSSSEDEGGSSSEDESGAKGCPTTITIREEEEECVASPSSVSAPSQVTSS